MQWKHKPYELLKIQEMNLKMEGFHYTISLYLGMGYYCTLTNILDEASKLCTTVVPVTKYEH